MMPPLLIPQDLEITSQLSTVDEQTQYLVSRSSTYGSLREEPGYFRPSYNGAPTAFCIQLFCIDEKHAARQVLTFRFSATVKNFLWCSAAQPLDFTGLVVC